MTLATLLLTLDAVSTTGNLDVELSGITDDSREVARGSLFVAVKAVSYTHLTLPTILLV